MSSLKEKIDQHLKEFEQRLEETSSVCGGTIKEQNQIFLATYKAGAYAVLAMVEEK